MKRRLLFIDPQARKWRLETLQVDKLEKDPRQDYWLLAGETLCQYLLQRDKDALIIARGPLPFITGNKATVGYISPLTGVPHYSIVGGGAVPQVLNLGLDAVCFESKGKKADNKGNREYVVVSGRAPWLTVEFKPADDLPTGQRSAYYWLLDKELAGDEESGSIFTLGEGLKYGYRSANLAVEAIYHAGRGGAGDVFARFASALVLKGQALEVNEFFKDPKVFTRGTSSVLPDLLDKQCARLSSKTGGTIIKLYATGCKEKGTTTLPSNNAQALNYTNADFGSADILKATRDGTTGCQWCQVSCRHWHWVPADYAPGGKDKFLDDFEPAYAIDAMLGLGPTAGSLEEKVRLLKEIDEKVIMPIEQMGCDVMNIGVALAAVYEAIEKDIIPAQDVPDFMTKGHLFGDVETAGKAMELMRTDEVKKFPALEAVGTGPDRLVELYPDMKDIVFTEGKGTLGNAGHCNALWTFLMPFSRFFGHYVGQCYKISEKLPDQDASEEEIRQVFQKVIDTALEREFFWLISNALSMCAFTFIIFSEKGKGQTLSKDDLLVRLLADYGIETTREDIEWFAQAFWAQSMVLKHECGWTPPAADDIPLRIYEALSQNLGRTPEELKELMAKLIVVWKEKAAAALNRFGYEVPWS